MHSNCGIQCSYPWRSKALRSRWTLSMKVYVDADLKAVTKYKRWSTSSVAPPQFYTRSVYRRLQDPVQQSNRSRRFRLMFQQHDGVCMVEKPQPLCTFQTLETHVSERERERERELNGMNEEGAPYIGATERRWGSTLGPMRHRCWPPRVSVGAASPPWAADPPYPRVRLTPPYWAVIWWPSLGVFSFSLYFNI
jgi:hypothetical protein